MSLRGRWCLLAAATTIALPLRGESAELKISVPEDLRADGRVLRLEVPAPAGFSGLAGLPLEPRIACEGAATLPVDDRGRPGIILPHRTRPVRLACTATLDTLSEAVTLRLAPGGEALDLELLDDVGAPGLRTIRWRVAPGDPAPPLELATNIGNAQVEGGQLAVTLPEDKAPRSLVMILRRGEAARAVFVPLPARARVPIKTRKRAQVYVRIAGRTEGPLTSRTGKLRVPLVVPEGVDTYHLVAVDSFGNRKEQTQRLSPPERPRLALLTPAASLPAGSRARVLVALADPTGGPAAQSVPPVGTLPSGEALAAKWLGPGLWALPIVLPPTVGGHTLGIAVPSDSGVPPATLTLSVVPEAPDRIELTLRSPEGEVLPTPLAEPRGVGSRLIVAARAVDTLGNVLPAAELVLEGLGTASQTEAGRWALELPGSLPERRALTLRVRGHGLTRTLELPLREGPLARASAEVTVDGRRGRAVLAAADAHGNPVSAEPLRVVLTGARIAGEEEAQGVRTLSFVAEKGIDAGDLRVEGPGGQALVERALTFVPEPTPYHLALGLKAGGGGLGRSLAPSVGLLVDLRRNLGRFEIGLTFAPGVRHGRGELDGLWAGVSWRVTSLALPLTARLRWVPSTALGGLGLGLEAGGELLLAGTTLLGPDFDQRKWTAVPGFVVGATVDYRLKRGRPFLRLGWGRAPLSTGPVQGQLQGPELIAGFTLDL